MSQKIQLFQRIVQSVPTHIAIDLAYGYEAQVRPRSGNSLKTKLRSTRHNRSYNKELESSQTISVMRQSC